MLSGNWNNTSNAGLFYSNWNNSSTNANFNIGSRSKIDEINNTTIL